MAREEGWEGGNIEVKFPGASGLAPRLGEAGWLLSENGNHEPRPLPIWIKLSGSKGIGRR